MIARAAPLALLAGTAVGAASAMRPAGDPDVFWHLATARETVAHGIVRADQFSWTAAGVPVSTDQWLGQVLLYSAYVVDGWAGIVLVRAAAIALIVMLVVANAAAARERVRPLVALVAALPAVFVSAYVWSERPELLGLACFAALLVLLRLGRNGSDRALALVPLLLLLWANTHGSFALGAVVVVLAAIEGSFADRSRARTYATVAVAALLATLVTPSGIASWTAPRFHLFSPPRELQEWALPDPRSGVGALFAVTVLIVVATAALARIELREAVILIPVGLLAVTAARHTPLFAVAAAPFLAARGPRALVIAFERFGINPPALAPPPRPARGVVVASTAIAILLAVAATAWAPRAPDESHFPVAALSVLPAGPGLLNEYDWGGWLIWTAPATPVFIDGRYTPFVGTVLDDYVTVIGADPGWSEALRRRGVRAILARPDEPVVLRGIEMGWPVVVRTPQVVLLRVP